LNSRWINIKDSDAVNVANSLKYPVPKTPHTNLDYFQFHKSNFSNKTLFFSKPALGLVTGEWRFFITRRLIDAGGSFAGVAGCAFIPGYYENLYKKLDLGETGQIDLIREDGTPLITAPLIEERMKKDYSRNPLLLKHLPEAAEGEIILSVNDNYAEKRMVSYQKLSKYPVIAKVSISYEEALQPWRARMAKQATLVLALLLASSWLCYRSWSFAKGLDSATIALDFSESRYRALFNESMDIVFETRLDGSIVEVNPAGLEILGYAPDDVQNTNVAKSIYTSIEDRQQFIELMAQKGFVKDFDLKLKTKEGTIIDVLISATAVKSPEGKTTGFRGIIRDTTAIKQKEQALRAREEILRAILNHHYQLTGLMSADGTLLMANETALKMVGLDEEDVVGRPFWETPWWEHSLELQDTIKDAIKRCAHGEFIRFETRHPDADGKLRDVDFSLTPLSLKDNDKIDYIIPEGRDITEIRQHEQALRESEERFRSIFESAAAPMAVIAPDGTFLQANQAACQFLEYSEEEILELKIGDITVHDDTKQEHDQFEKLRVGDCTSVEYEKQYRSKNGSINWGHSTMAAVRDVNGELLHIVALTQNITEQKQAESELVKHRDNLESLVAEKTQELQVAQKELLKKERLATLGQLTATVSHELRNPLGAVSNGLHIIKTAMESNDKDMANNALRLSERGIHRCVRIIEGLLDYGKKGKMELKPVAINDLANEIFDEMAWPEEIHLRKTIENDVLVLGDKEGLRRVILNLLINAQQALQEGTQSNKYILFSVRTIDNKAEIIIEDNGPGIVADLHEKIFEPLFSTKNFGVGLGMTVVKEVIQAHKGKVELQSIGEHGCRFVIEIPLS
jgi:PAS domain S-box-containing protein